MAAVALYTKRHSGSSPLLTHCSFTFNKLKHLWEWFSNLTGMSNGVILWNLFRQPHWWYFLSLVSLSFLEDAVLQYRILVLWLLEFSTLLFCDFIELLIYKYRGCTVGVLVLARQCTVSYYLNLTIVELSINHHILQKEASMKLKSYTHH